MPACDHSVFDAGTRAPAGRVIALRPRRWPRRCGLRGRRARAPAPVRVGYCAATLAPLSAPRQW